MTINFSGTPTTLGSINMVGGDKFWGYNGATSTGMHISDQNNTHTAYWIGSMWIVN
ncbi:hypothetical protein SBF1_9300001 [Candidatus Desulfosporosinus infrequens]|uniref:Uncharacterized protein n=1 Tax=Candidatus Desulfosporosinus infrequens TaxID=2043169 RepID=A0A2U3LXD5_9FIRM|nr:hypothetical protein SBF1_9300001 [Candidatus Desulfosporosinus infrequens]